MVHTAFPYSLYDLVQYNILNLLCSLSLLFLHNSLAGQTLTVFIYQHTNKYRKDNCVYCGHH